jgi:hypothetical protein
VCQVFKYYYFVPYNLFRLFLVHKMSIYAYVYGNRKIEMEKGKGKKKRNFPANWAGGNFGPARGRAGPRASEEGGRC